MVLDLLKTGEFSCRQAGEALGIDRNTARRHLVAAHKQKIVYIADWHRCTGRLVGGDWAAVYALGKKKDAPMPERSVAIESKRYRAKYRGLVAARGAAERGTLTPFSQLLWAAR
jgi:predicted ArsR family transcriptional regulator